MCVFALLFGECQSVFGLVNDSSGEMGHLVRLTSR
jgi:hypothetical protein